MNKIFAIILLCFSSSALSADATGSLTDALTRGLGVSNEQATGGLGSLFGLAKATLDSGQFSKLSSAVPGMGELLKAAPEVEAKTKSLGGLSSALGGYGEALQGASEVYAQFQSLGLDATAIPQYVDITNNYLNSSGGQSAVDLFTKGISSML